MAGIRREVNPKYATGIDNGVTEKKFVSFYISKFSCNHTPESILTKGEKNTIFKTVRNMVLKDDKRH